MKTDTALSRRGLLASVPALAATAAPVVGNAMGGVAIGDDTELLEPGRKLAPLVAEINAARAIDRKRLHEFDARLAALGLKDEAEYADVGAYMTERTRLGKLVHERDEESVELDFDRMHDDLFALLDEILEIQPTTLEGFTIQVLAIVTAHDDLCYESEENEPLPYGVTDFFRNMCGFVGVPIPA